MSMKSAALYARVSSDRQAHEKTIESQIACLKDYAASNNFKVDDDLIFIDNGISGSLLERPGLDALRDAADNGVVTAVIILCPDRLARKHAYQLLIMEEFKQLGVDVFFVDHKNTNTPEDQLLVQIQGVISEYERAKIMDRCRRGKLHKAKTGVLNVMSRAPYGYNYIPRTEHANATIVVNIAQAGVVRRIFSLYVDQRKSLSKVSRLLTLEKIPSPAGVQWSPCTVRNIVTSETYCGRAAYRKTELIDRVKKSKLLDGKVLTMVGGRKVQQKRRKEDWIYMPVPAIISKELFEQVAARIEENKRLSPRNNKKHHYLLSGFLSCKQCGYAYFARYEEKSKKFYYYCSGTKTYRWYGQKKCTSPYVRREAIEDIVWAQVSTLLKDPEIVLNQYKNRIDKANDSKELDDLIKNKKREISSVEKQKGKLLDLFQSDLLEKQELESRLLAIRHKLKHLADEENYLISQKLNEQKTLRLINNIEIFTDQFNKNLDNLSFEKKREVLTLIVERVHINAMTKEITINHILPIVSDDFCQLNKTRRHKL